ncbi:MAG: pantoate--beta-alanine ligase, partial [Muribaculaceae bacterium]|nr:pantoate--beta-alanine ligase [Muribaculaceae bacterium]
MRPGHFNGVAQIVSKLFDMVQPHRAYFGEKDFQQIAVIRRMVELEGFNIDIIDCPIMREIDGLAMSSRNIRLTPSQRQIAPAIYKALVASIDYAKSHSVKETKQHVIDEINAQPEMEVEYYEIVDSLTMQPINNWDDSNCPVGCITVYCGEVRLIDNIKYTK